MIPGACAMIARRPRWELERRARSPAASTPPAPSFPSSLSFLSFSSSRFFFSLLAISVKDNVETASAMSATEREGVSVFASFSSSFFGNASASRAATLEIIVPVLSVLSSVASRSSMHGS
eukprot:31297-Pelagococcus_subviridis.AAC.6